jgi:hypothetical protein
MDRTNPCEGLDVGSIPTGGTNKKSPLKLGDFLFVPPERAKVFARGRNRTV